LDHNHITTTTLWLLGNSFQQYLLNQVIMLATAGVSCAGSKNLMTVPQLASLSKPVMRNPTQNSMLDVEPP
jgi:hypothetical protein